MKNVYQFIACLNVLLITILVMCVGLSFAKSDSFTQKDRELLIRLDERLNQIDKRFEQIDKRFEQIDKRFEQIDIRIRELREDMNKRFEQVDKRFEQVDKRFETLIQLMIAIVGAFAAIVAVTIGFALWDRRSMIRPFESKVKEMEEQILTDRRRLNDLIRMLKKLAEDDPKLASLLKSFSLL